MGIRSNTKRAEIDCLGYTCLMAREQIKANSLKMGVGVVGGVGVGVGVAGVAGVAVIVGVA
eukprot:3226641-Pyramimonas_sp.AAC.1